MGVELARLLANCIDNPRMAMADMRHVVVHVEVAPAIGIVEPDPLAFDEVDRLVIEQPVGGTHGRLPAIQQRF